MKKIIIILALLLQATAAVAVTERPFPQLNPAATLPALSFRFAVIGDFRAAKRDLPYPQEFRQSLVSMERATPAFIASTGDAWYGYGGTMAEFRKEVDAFVDIAGGVKVPFFNAIGNHEVTDLKEREAYVREKTGRLYGSIDYAGSHFVFLDTDEVGKAGMITGDQLRWLEKDLDENSRAENVFVFMHRPLFSVEDPDLKGGRSFRDRQNRGYLHSLFARHKIRAVFAGHEHLYDFRVKDGVNYYITGGGGSPLSKVPGAFFHYLMVTVKGKAMQVEVFSPEGKPVPTVTGAKRTE